ncbi:MAG: hypothetical protein HQM08_17340 [Candidatus Riflebacteria bacterium]|nr:hypothetical protein [Candidatus Riflebacteria bacterium]
MDATTISIAVTILLAWSGLLIGIIKYLLDRQSRLMDEQIKLLRDENRSLREELSKLREQLPEKYVRQESCHNCREEFQTMLATIDQRLSNFSDKLLSKIDEFRSEIYAR